MKENESVNTDKIKYLQELINTGTPTERALAYIRSSFNIEQGPMALNEEEAHVLAVSFTTPEELREANSIVGIFNIMVQYSKGLEAARSKYREEAARLTGLIGNYEILYYIYENISIYKDKKGQYYSTNKNKDKQPEDNINISKEVKISLVADKGGKTLPENGLSLKDIYTKMKEQSRKTAEALAIFKSKLEVIKAYIMGGGRLELWSQLIPNNLANMILRPDYIPEKEQENLKKYFKENLREREEKGETIGTQEKKLALYPYYANLRTIKKVKEEAKNELEQLINIWQSTK